MVTTLLVALATGFSTQVSNKSNVHGLQTKVRFIHNMDNLHIRLTLTSTFGNYERKVHTESTQVDPLVRIKSTDACIFSLPKLRVRCRTNGMNTMSDHLIVEVPHFGVVLVNKHGPRSIVAGSVTGSLTAGVSQRSNLISKIQVDVPFT